MPERIRNYPVFGLCGYKNSGKTTLVCRLVEEFTRRGLRMATVKFAHCDIDIDHEGRDSFRHRQAGARQVAVVSPYRWAVVHEIDHAAGERPPPLHEVLAHIGPADLVLVEGNKSGKYPKIEVRDIRHHHPLLADTDAHVLAIAANGPLTHPRVPVFHRDDITAIADFIQHTLALPMPQGAPQEP